MCGRYRQSRSRRLLEEEFHAIFDSDDEIVPRFNIAPTQPVLAIRQEPDKPQRRMSVMRWGLIPFWAKDANIGNRTLNARAETLSATPAFREAFKSQRCLIPADGFYEWRKNGKVRQPFCFEVGQRKLFAFAGLWDKWRDGMGKIVESCTILTTKPNSIVADIHDRMPVVLNPENYGLWLDPKFSNPTVLSEMLAPYDAGMMRLYPVSTKLNDAKNESEDCGVAETGAEAVQSELF